MVVALAYKDILSVAVLVSPLSSVAVVVLVLVSSIDNEAAAVDITELKPRSDAMTNRNAVMPARLILVLRNFIIESTNTMSVKRFSLML
jgi:hypothetical protein